MQYPSRHLFLLALIVLILLLACGFAAAFNINRARYDGRSEIAFSNSYSLLPVDECASPTPTPSLEVPAILQPRNGEIVTVMNPSLLSGVPGDTLKLMGTLTNTTSETFNFGGFGFIAEDPSICLEGNAPACPILGFVSRLSTNPIPPQTSTGEVDIIDIRLNPAYAGPLPIIIRFTFHTTRPGMFSGITTFSVRILPRTDPSRPPVLYADPCTLRAVALNSVNLTLEPFALTNSFNFSSDQRTRVTVFAWNMNLLPSEGAAAVTLQAIDSQQAIHVLPVESVSDVASHPGLTQIIVRLPDNLPLGTDLRLRVLVHGFTSNEAPMAINPG